MLKHILASCLLAYPLLAGTPLDTMNPALSTHDHHLAIISACAAKGDIPALKEALRHGLDAGLPLSTAKEILTQAYAYCGFPRSLNALQALMEVADERANAGISTTAGKEPSPRPEGNALDFGTENQTRLVGAPVTGRLFQFAPAIDEYLKAHLFGDIFSRDNVSWKTRELATIAFLASMPGTDSQLASHIKIGQHNGLTDEEVESVLDIARKVKHEDAFPLGSPADASVFTGDAWVSQLLQHGEEYGMAAYNVTFAPGTRNNWHSHTHGQILLCTVGTGFYQEKGKPARELHPGDVVEIPANTLHWHGAAPHATFVHLGITPHVQENKTTWGAPVTDAEYREATAQ